MVEFLVNLLDNAAATFQLVLLKEKILVFVFSSTDLKVL